MTCASSWTISYYLFDCTTLKKFQLILYIPGVHAQSISVLNHSISSLVFILVILYSCHFLPCADKKSGQKLASEFTLKSLKNSLSITCKFCKNCCQYIDVTY